MKELFRVVLIFFICLLTVFLLRNTGSGFEYTNFLVIAAGVSLYLADFLTRRFFPDDVMSIVLGVISGGILSWAGSQWISSLTFLSGFLERFPWRPFLNVVLTFLSVLWISSSTSVSRSFVRFSLRQDFQEKPFNRLYIFLMVLSAGAFAMLIFSNLQTQGLWQGHPASDWVLNMAQGNYDFQLKVQKSMNAAPMILGAGLAAFFAALWILRRHCLPYIGLVLVLFVFVGFLNHLFLNISGDILSKGMPSDVLQLFILLNALYFGLSWGLHVIQRKDFRRF
jgi:hypothetical protein